MADPRNNAKATGDTHLPEVESDDFGMESGHPQGTGTEGTQARGRLTRGGARRGGRHAGELRDAPAGDDADGTAGPGEGR